MAESSISLRRVFSPVFALAPSRLVRHLAGVALTLGVAFACSNDPTVLPTGFVDPATLAISSISLSKGNVLPPNGGSTQLACDYTIGVALDIGNWDLRQPGACPVTQCGRVRIQLSDATRTLIDKQFASSGITLDLSSFSGAGTEAPLVAGAYTLTASLINDAGNPYNPGNGDTGTVQASFRLDLPGNCETDSGSAGSAGSGPGAEGGAAGLAGSAGASESAGAGGDSAAGADGTADVGGSSGTSGSSGTAGSAGSSGSGGTAGSSGSSGAPSAAGAAGE